MDFRKNIPVLAKIKVNSELVSFSTDYWFNSIEVVVSVPYPTTPEKATKCVVDILSKMDPVPVDNTAGYEDFIDEAKSHMKKVINLLNNTLGLGVSYKTFSGEGNVVLECDVSFSHAEDLPE